jgi:beta-glucosidase
MAARTYRYFPGAPLYPFGYGLTYSTFSITDAAYSGGRLPRAPNPDGFYATPSTGGTAPRNAPGTPGTVTATIKNLGPVDASEVVQVYAETKGTKERWTLAGFAPVFLTAGSTTAVTIPLAKTAFARYDAKGDLQPLPGPHTLHVGFTQPDSVSIARAGTIPLDIIVEG